MRSWCVLSSCLLALACGDETRLPDEAPPKTAVECPADHVPDEARLDRLLTLLADTDEARGLIEPRPNACFGDPPQSVVTDKNLLILRTDSGDAEAAARVGHLLHHVRHGLPYQDGPEGRPCDARVEEALQREARAYALEIALRVRLGVESPLRPYPFEADVRREPDRGEELVRTWLRSHPAGGANVDGLANAYRERCEAGFDREGLD